MDNNPRPWPPYSKDCSQGICSYYCPQWCFFLFPPPPPSPPSSHPHLSPLLIAVVAIVSTAFVLVAYYLILSHYRRTRSRARSSVLTAALPDNLPWHAARRDGLDESLINKIAACQYRAGGGLIVDGTDCSVCLSQFEDGDQIRLLPKCSHPFHLRCIDTWLKSHSTCPLCRAGIFPLPALPNDTLISTTTTVMVEENEVSQSGSDTTSSTENVNHDVIEIGEGPGLIGRSLSMDSQFRRRVELNSNSGTNTDTSTGTWSRALHSLMISPVRMKRSRSLTSILPT